MDEEAVLQILILTTVGLSLSLFDTAAGFTGQLEAATSNHHTSTILGASASNSTVSDTSAIASVSLVVN